VSLLDPQPRIRLPAPRRRQQSLRQNIMALLGGLTLVAILMLGAGIAYSRHDSGRNYNPFDCLEGIKRDMSTLLKELLLQCGHHLGIELTSNQLGKFIEQLAHFINFVLGKFVLLIFD